MKWTKTEKGWICEITNRYHGCLDKGGVCGRREWWSNTTLIRVGIDPKSDPDEGWNDFVSIGEYVKYLIPSDRVLRKGTPIN